MDGVLAMRLTCEEEDGGRGCLRQVSSKFPFM